MKPYVLVLVPIIAVATFFLAPKPESQKQVLETSEQFTLYSLYPYRRGNMEGEKFHRYRVLGKVLIKDAQVKQKLIAALYKSVSEAQGTTGCHDPRHGIRAVKGSRTVDLTICFECVNVEFYDNGNRTHVDISGSPKRLFNQVLLQHDVPLSKE